MKTLARIFAVFMIAMLSLSLSGGILLAQEQPPPVPYRFYGAASIGGNPAPDGTVISAEVNGVELTKSVTSGGKYGYGELEFDVAAAKGDTVVFKINGVTAQSYSITESPGSLIELDLAVASAPPAEVSFTVTNLSISPGVVEPGEELSISAMVTNSGSLAGSYTARLKINGSEVDSQEVSLEPGESQAVSFTVSRGAEGEYSVVLDGLEGSFTVRETPSEAHFVLADLSVLPAEVEPGEEVNILATVSNDGGVEGSYTVKLKINGSEVDSEELTLAAGASQTVSFTVSQESSGEYSVELDGLEGSFTVAEAPPPPSPTNLRLIGGIIGGVVIIGLIALLVARRRRAM